MTFNPLQEKGISLDRQLRNWNELNVKPYDKYAVDPYSRTRVIVMNGIEVEANFFSHQFARHCTDLELKRRLAEIRRIEQQQQKCINWLTPASESTLEVTIGYEQVAVDLTAWLARNEPDPYMKQTLDFGLLEDFDHLYRYANLLHLLEGSKADRICGGHTEIMPGRPTLLEHRHPIDDVKNFIDSKTAHPLTALHNLTIVAAEQQTMNFYMTIGNRYQEPLARQLYQEIAMIEEQHVTQYESLMDPSTTWLQQAVLHEYNECYMYYSFLETETDPSLRRIWELHLGMEIEQLRIMCDLFRKTENRDPESFLPALLSKPVTFEENKDYVRSVLESQVDLTGDGTDFVPVDSLPSGNRFESYQKIVHGDARAASQEVISLHERRYGRDYRFQSEGPHPVDGRTDSHLMFEGKSSEQKAG